MHIDTVAEASVPQRRHDAQMLRRLLVDAIVLFLVTPAGTASSEVVLRRADSSVLAPRAARAVEVPGTGFRSPLPPPLVVLTGFDPPDRPWGAGHRGVDLAGSVGTAVRAAGDGEVVYAGQLAGRGVVSVQHPNGLRTTYEPVDPVVGAGERVVAGQVLGRLAAGHPSCAPAVCLHWGARTGPDVYVDPMLLVTGWRVRLWPWDVGPGDA